MSLTDLKKGTQPKPKKKNFTIDEFIADAENYAVGQPEIISGEIKNSSSVEQAIKIAKQQLKTNIDEKEKPYRHATFTLSEQSIAQLQKLSKETKLAKSHIIRILIDELCQKEPDKKLKKLLDSDID